MLLFDIYRHTFPKGLRFCTHCRLLHAYLFVVVKRNKHRRYIPKEEFQQVLDMYISPTPAVVKLIRVPIVRHVLFLRQINSFRVLCGRKSWLITPAVEVEFNKAKKWFDNEVNRNRSSKKLAELIEREKFQEEVLDRFPVASLYHRGLRVGILVLSLTIVILWVAAFSEYCLYLYFKHWLHLSREDVMELLRQATLAHLMFTVPEGYQAKLPPPAIIVKRGEQLPAGSVMFDSSLANAVQEAESIGVNESAAGDRIFVTVCEFVSPDRKKSVLVLPVPQCGTRSFFSRVGQLVNTCDGLLLEGASQKVLPVLAPMMFLPTRNNTFEAAKLQHRYFPLLGQAAEPPQLYAGAMPPSIPKRIRTLLTPFAMRSVYLPIQSASTKAEAKIAWGFLREVLENPETMLTSSHIDPSVENVGELKPISRESFTLAVPWTAAQVVSLEASLLKYGYELVSFKHLEWLPLDHIGESFCDHFSYSK